MSQVCFTLRNSETGYCLGAGQRLGDDLFWGRWQIKPFQVHTYSNTNEQKCTEVAVNIVGMGGEVLGALGRQKVNLRGTSDWTIRPTKEQGKFFLLHYSRSHSLFMPEKKPLAMTAQIGVGEYTDIALEELDCNQKNSLQKWYIKKNGDNGYVIINCSLPVEIAPQGQTKTLHHTVWIRGEGDEYKHYSRSAVCKPPQLERVTYDVEKKMVVEVPGTCLQLFREEKDLDAITWEKMPIGPVQDFPIQSLLRLSDQRCSAEVLEFVLSSAESQGITSRLEEENRRLQEDFQRSQEENTRLLATIKQQEEAHKYAFKRLKQKMRQESVPE